MLGDVVGAEEMLTRHQGELGGVEVIDERRLRACLIRPQSIFPMMIADSVASVLKEQNVADWPIEWTNDSEAPVRKIEFEPDQLPVGAAPSSLRSSPRMFEKEECTFVPNDRYWGDQSETSKVEYLIVPML